MTRTTILAALARSLCGPCRAATYQVGPGRTYTQLTQVAPLLNPGYVVAVDGNASQGNLLDAISDFFAGSPESRDCSLSNADFVPLVYNNVLGRAPDAGGHAFWTSQLDTNARARGQVMLGFSDARSTTTSSIPRSM